MSFVAAAVVGGAAISAYASNRASERATEATQQATETSAQVTRDTTRMQIDEIQRQFDIQQEMLAPFVAQQERASAEYGRQLGFGAGARPGQRPGRDERGFVDPNVDYSRLGDRVTENRLAPPQAGRDELVRHVDDTALTQGGPGADTRVQRAEDVRLGDQITGTEAQERAGAVRLRDTAEGERLAAEGGFTNDPRFQFTQDTAVVGDEFEESPGYNYAVEQSMREVERRNSAGGNYGGRALMEAQRRAEGEAAQEYYNWVGARQRDLSRQDQAVAAHQGREAFDASNIISAERTDVARGDQALDADIARRLSTEQYDIGRGDAALADFRRREELDTGRRDTAMENYMGRRSQDVQRGDQAFQYDQARRDQAYQNYLGRVGAGAGLNTGATQAVTSSQRASGQTANALGQRGATLANLYTRQGENTANIAMGNAANINSSIQSGIGNWLTYRALNQAGGTAAAA